MTTYLRRGRFWLTLLSLSTLAAAGASVKLISSYTFTGNPVPTSGLTQITGGADGSQGSSPNALLQSSHGDLYGAC